MKEKEIQIHQRINDCGNKIEKDGFVGLYNLIPSDQKGACQGTVQQERIKDDHYH